MRPRLFAAAKYVLYPLFYLTCLFACLYLTFPWDRLKDRIETEFARSQESKGSRAWRLQIDSLDGYWLSGVELSGAKIIMPPEEEEDDAPGGKPAKRGALAKVAGAAARKSAADDDEAATDGGKDDKEPEKPPLKDTIVLITEAHARVQLLPLLWGSVRVNFAASVFNGEVRGVIPIGGGDLLLEVENVDLAQVAPLKDVVGLPIKGIANGKLELTAANGKWSKATGTFNLAVTDMVIGDGKSKFRDLGVTFTPATVGTFEIQAKATEGNFKFEKFGSTGQEVELAADGTLKLKEPWDASVMDLWLRFGFSEEYKHKDDRTQALFVDDGPFPALISQDRKLKRAKRTDGLWGFHIHGKLQRLKYDPTTADGPRGKTSDATKKKPAKDDDEEDDSASAASKPTTASPFISRSPGAPKRPINREAIQPEPAPGPDGAEPSPVDTPPIEPDAPPPEPEAPPPGGEEPQQEPPPDEQPAPAPK